MTRVIVHAGFHKTGTTSLQSFMTANEAVLGAHIRFLRKRHFAGAAKAAARIARHPRNPYFPARFALGFAQVLLGLNGRDPRPVVLSWEGFSGAIPGTHGITDYRHAVRIARLAARLIRLRFGRDVDLTFLYTTRAAADWQRSAHAHLVKRFPYTLDLDEYRAAFPAAPGFDAVLERLQTALAPAKVRHAALEDFANAPFGPADAILALIALPAEARAKLVPVAPRNLSASAETTEQLRHMNTDEPHTAEMLRKKAELAARAP